MKQAISVGMKAPNFVLNDQFGDEFSFAGLMGKKTLLSSHPLSWTGVCTLQMQALDKVYDQFEALNVTPFGLSVDPSPAKKAWGESMGLKKLRLLSDFWPHGGVSESLGIFRPDDGYTERTNILIAEDGKIAWVKVYEMKTLPDFEEILGFLRR